MGTDTGRYLAELRRSSAAGKHNPTGTRRADKQGAIQEYLDDMEEPAMDAEVISFPAPLEVQPDPSDEEVLALDADAVRASKEFELLCREFGLTATGEELPVEDYVPEPDLGSLDDYRVVSGDPEEEYEWTANE
jgi:hypothetical protein